MKVFVDTGAWLALEIKNDINHSKAREFLQTLKKRRALLFTNAFVLAETYTRLIYDVSLDIAKKFHGSINQGIKSNLTILEVDKTAHDLVWKQLDKFKDHKFSYIDGTIIVQFKNYQLDTIFTYDRQFRNINLPTSFS